MTDTPQTVQDWIIRALNIHGAIFERWCRSVVRGNSSWSIRSTNEPVEFPPSNGPFAGEESEVDIRAESTNEGRRITLLIECKKNNPEFINWLFFGDDQSQTSHPFTLFELINDPRDSGGWTTRSIVKTVRLTLATADDAREVRGDYVKHQKGDKTRTSNKAITDAARQVTIGTQAVALKETTLAKQMGAMSPAPAMPWRSQVLIPIIVTSAKLVMCEFDPSHVNAESGEIPPAHAAVKEVPHVMFEYPVPERLQSRPQNAVEAIGSERLFTRKSILILTSSSFASLLTDLAGLQLGSV